MDDGKIYNFDYFETNHKYNLIYICDDNINFDLLYLDIMNTNDSLEVTENTYDLNMWKYPYYTFSNNYVNYNI